MSIALIVAASQNNVIGRDNDLPWYLPTDLAHFKTTTKGKVCIMGRNTYNSIYARLNKPLPHRQTIVLSRSADTADATEFQFDNVHLVHSIEDALATAETLAPSAEHMLCGGAQLYNEFLQAGFVDKIYLTKVLANIDGDATLNWPEDFNEAWQGTCLNTFTENDYHAEVWEYQKAT